MTNVRCISTLVLQDIVYGWRNSTERAETVAACRRELERRERRDSEPVVRDPQAWAAVAKAGGSHERAAEIGSRPNGHRDVWNGEAL
jgi:hypothetical protein